MDALWVGLAALATALATGLGAVPFAFLGSIGPRALALANAADGGTRTCLSVDRDTPVRQGSRAHDAGYATVADVTRARLAAVADTVGGGYREVGSVG